MDLERIRENQLSSILKFSIPSIIAMFLSTVLTITDGYFTGNYVGEEAIAAINLGLPVLYFYLGLGLCVGVGGSVICGRMLGAKDESKASRIFTQTVATSLIVCIVTSVFVYLFFEPILKFLGAAGKVAGYFREYYRIMLFHYPMLVLGTVLGMFIRADGKPQVCMFISIIGCILNFILDYILVAKLSMGVKGSAAGSLMVETVAVVIQFLYFAVGSEHVRYKRFVYDKNVNREMILNGSSEFIGEMASAISMFVFNYVLMKYVGTEGVAAFTILGFTVYGYSMIVIGVGQGIAPLVSLCWGAEDRETASGIRKLANRILAGTGTAVAVTFVIFGGHYARAFGCSDQVAGMVQAGFKIFAVTFMVTGYNVIGSMYFTSCGDAKSSALISSLRGIILQLIFAAVFPALWNMTGVWLVTPTAEFLTALVSMGLLMKQRRISHRGYLADGR